MKKFRGIIIFLVPFLLAASSDKYEKWLKDEVHLIITKAEVKEFKALRTDEEKDRFIALFWAKRDPVPDTPVNEFKVEYEKRLEYADRMFYYAGIKGSERSMGKVYVIFGPPKRREGANVWVYDPIPQWNLPTQFFIRFYQFVGGYAIDEKETAKQALSLIDNYAEKTILHPDLKEAPPMAEPAAAAGISEGDLLNALVSGGADRFDFPVFYQVVFTKIAGQKTLVTSIMDIDAAGLGDPKPIIFGRFLKEGAAPFDFKSPIDPIKQGKTSRIILNFPLDPGIQQALFGVESEDKLRYAVFKKILDIPDFWTGELQMSTPILTNKIEKAAQSTKSAEFLFGKDLVFPGIRQRYTAADTLYFYYSIYNAAIQNGAVSLLEEVELESESRTFRIPSRPYAEKVSVTQNIFLWSSIPVSYLTPGAYKLTITVTDKLTGKAVKRTSAFEVAGKE